MSESYLILISKICIDLFTSTSCQSDPELVGKTHFIMVARNPITGKVLAYLSYTNLDSLIALGRVIFLNKLKSLCT